MSKYFPNPKTLAGNVKVELDLSNYATKSDLKNQTGADTSNFAKKVHLATLKSSIDKLVIDKLEKVPDDLSVSKSKVDELDIGKSKTTPVDLSKLSNLVKNNTEDKIPDITDLATNSSLKYMGLKMKYLVLLT